MEMCDELYKSKKDRSPNENRDERSFSISYL